MLPFRGRIWPEDAPLRGRSSPFSHHSAASPRLPVGLVRILALIRPRSATKYPTGVVGHSGRLPRIKLCRNLVPIWWLGGPDVLAQIRATARSPEMRG